MADAVRLFGQFQDEQGTEWKVNLHDADFSGSATEVLLTSEGFVLQYSGDNENRMQPIIGSALSFGIQMENSTVEGIVGLIEDSDEGRFTCTVVKDPDGTPSLFWSGVVLGDQVVIADEYFPIMVKLRAVDDLGNLRNVLYKSGGVGYGGEATMAQHLNQCILKLRHVQNITWGDPLVWWANNFTATGINPAIDQISRVGVHHAAFYNLDDEGEAQFTSAFDVLQQICLTFNCRLFQHHGAFWMVPVGIYGTFTSTASWTFYNIDGAGNVSTGESVTLSKIIGTDLLRMVGNEMTHMPPLQEVRKVWQVRGDLPAINFTQYLNSIGGLFPPDLLGTTVTDAGLAYAQDDEIKLQGEYRQGWATDGTLTGQDTIGTLFLKMQIKVGTQYLVNTLTFSTTQWASVAWLSGTQNRRPFTISDAAWQSTAGFYYYPVITATNLTHERAAENPWLHFISVVLPVVPSAQTGMEITVDVDGRGYDGSAITNFGDSFAYARLNMSAFRLHESSSQLQQLAYVASFDTESQTKIRQDLLLGSTQFPAGIDGAILDMSGTPSEAVATFASLARPTESAQPIHQIAATEILQGQKHSTLIRRGRYFGDFISPLHFLILDTDKFLPFQTTYVANACETDLEAFKVAFNGTDMQTPSVQGTFTDVGDSGGSISDTFTPALDEAVDEIGKQVGTVITDVEAIQQKTNLITITQAVDLDDVEADTAANTGNISSISYILGNVEATVKLMYETFQPKGTDYGVTSVKYQDLKTDGMAMNLQQQQLNLASSTGNTQLLMTESSAGTIQLKAQDELPTGAGTHLALYATARSTTGGSVGINTSSPTATLHVAGNAKVEGSVDLVTILGMATDQDLTPTEGQITYNFDQDAWLVGMAGDEVRSIDEDWWVCKNQTGSTIAAGVPVYAAGTLGSSGRKLIAPMIADGTINARYFLGVTAHSISNGADGIVMDRGTIKGVNTSSFSESDVLWVDQSTAGTFTATEPSSGQKIAAGFVINAASNGIIAVRNLGEESAGGGGGGNAFGLIAVAGQSDVVADAAEDTLTMVAGSNMVLTTDAATDSITVALSSTPSITSLTVGSTGIVSVGNISTLGNLSASGSVSCNSIGATTVSVQSTLTTSTAIVGQLLFTGGGTSSIGIATGLPNQPDDLQITSNGHVTIQLDADDDETAQHFQVKASDGTVLFQVDEDGVTAGLLTTATPTITGLPSSVQQGSTVNAASISNFDAAADYAGKVYNSSGVEQTSSPVTIDSSGGISFTAPSTIATGYELRIHAAALGKLRSVEAVGTFEVTASRTFTHWRMQGCTSNGTPSSSKLGVIEMNYWTGLGGTGTKYPTTAATSNTSISGVTISAGAAYSGYAAWEAFDRSGANDGYNDGSGSMWWTLGNSVAANNWNQLEFSSAVTFQSVTVHVYRSFSDATHVKILGSNTGAFSGEEVECAIIALDGSATGAGQTYTGNL
jgi:hypothetical protein